MTKKTTYRISFHNQGQIYEIYALDVHQSGLFGFIEVENIVFGEKTAVVVDPSEEKLKTEFEGVQRTYLPMHSVIRIDEVEKSGQGKIMDSSQGGSTVTPFQIFPSGQNTPKT